MKVVVMAGGRGSRLGGVEKPLLEVCGRPMVEAALGAARALGEPVLCTSPLAPNVERRYCGRVRCVRGIGEYVADLDHALREAGPPALVLPADMPFLDLGLVELMMFVEAALESESHVVTLNLCREGSCHESGISLFKSRGGDWENVYASWRAAFLDVDVEEDLREAIGLCGTMVEGPGRRWTSA